MAKKKQKVGKCANESKQELWIIDVLDALEELHYVSPTYMDVRELVRLREKAIKMPPPSDYRLVALYTDVSVYLESLVTERRTFLELAATLRKLRKVVDVFTRRHEKIVL